MTRSVSLSVPPLRFYIIVADNNNNNNNNNSEQHARDLLEAKSELLKLRAPLTRTEEERGILKKAARYFARESD
ncbi:transposase [Dickeya zeae EC1]|nr:transposase [Dickeya zeae EC1]